MFLSQSRTKRYLINIFSVYLPQANYNSTPIALNEDSVIRLDKEEGFQFAEGE
jgi:hypothetical protein